MLQDLDKRGSANGSDAENFTSPAHVRTVLASAGKSWPGWWVAVAAIALAVVIGTLLGKYFWSPSKPVPALAKTVIPPRSSLPSSALNAPAIPGKTTPITIAALSADPAPAPEASPVPGTNEVTPVVYPPQGNSVKPQNVSVDNIAPLSTGTKLALENTLNVGKNPATDVTKDFSAEPLRQSLQQNTDSGNANGNTSPFSKTRKTSFDTQNAEKNIKKKVASVKSDNAEKITTQAKEVTPQQAIENSYRKAVSLIDAGQLSQAIFTLEQVLQLEPKHAAARQTLVGLLLDAKRQDDAMRRLQEGLAIDPAQSGMAMILARLQVERGNARAGQQTLERSLPYALNDAAYQAFFAALLQRENRNKEAIEHYAIALRKIPENGVWWMGYGISLQAENRLPEAKDAFTRAKESASLSAVLQTFVDQKLSQMPH